ncbi:hypothetical protein BE21_11205 [Sorangium cellulosum]|uniref:Twin-arginine translocation signal domain-containing protein n=1 Tax=Sorangium cellulosum TaxID=56 RepID=A0A150U194_SORCE|nr:hypothetical protein BE21_11205 [Sorangium cellulosum]
MIDRRRFLTHTAVAGSSAALGCAPGHRGLDQEVASAWFHGDDALAKGQAAGVWHRCELIGQPVMDAARWYFLAQARLFDWLDERVTR